MGRAFALLVSFATLIGNFAQAAPPVPLTPEVGGSNFVIYQVGNYPKTRSEEDWAKIKFVIPHFHENKPVVLKALSDMYAAGQRKISLMIWYIPSWQNKLSNPSGAKCITQNHVICPDNGKLPEQMLANLTEILKAIESLKYEQVIIRFGAQWYSDPFSWPEGPKGEEYYKNFLEDSWNFISSIHTKVDAMKLKVPRVYDLGGELMGHVYSVRPWVSQYLVEMLKRYKKAFGTADSVGFSFNFGGWSGGRQESATRESLRMFDAAAFRPAYLALDVYEGASGSLPALERLLKQQAWPANIPIYIQETFYNDTQIAQQLNRYKGALNLRYVMQWPTKPNGGHFQLDLPIKYDAYLTAPKDDCVFFCN